MTDDRDAKFLIVSGAIIGIATAPVRGLQDLAKSVVDLHPFVSNLKGDKPKYCSTGGSLATMEAIFDVGDKLTMIEKYCDDYSKNIA